MSINHMIDYSQHSAHNYALNAWDSFLMSAGSLLPDEISVLP